MLIFLLNKGWDFKKLSIFVASARLDWCQRGIRRLGHRSSQSHSRSLVLVALLSCATTTDVESVRRHRFSR